VYFAGIQTTKEHNGYYYSVGETLPVVILGSLFGLRNVSQINQWSEEQCVKDFLLKHFGIQRILCYYWLLSLLKLIEPSSMKVGAVDAQRVQQKADNLVRRQNAPLHGKDGYSHLTQEIGSEK